MKNIVTVTKAVYVDGRSVELTFNDGAKGVVDFSVWINKYPFFEPLKDAEYFKNFSLDGWTVYWPNGADIAPETLHRIVISSKQGQTA